LDEMFHAFLVWKGESRTTDDCSVEIVGLPDLHDKIAPELYAAVTAIHRAPKSVSSTRFRSLPLFQAVNVLQRLGREQAGKAIEAYLRLEKQLTFIEATKYQIDSFRLYPILQLLLENPKEPLQYFHDREGPVADIPGAVVPQEPAMNNRKSWPFFPLTLVDEFPFTVSDHGVTAHVQEDRLLEYFYDSRTGFRARPLSPLYNPVEAADVLVDSQSWRDLEFSPAENALKKAAIRRQAVQALSPLVRFSSEDCPGGIFGPSENRWTQMREEVRQLRIRWDPIVENFVRRTVK